MMWTWSKIRRLEELVERIERLIGAERGDGDRDLLDRLEACTGMLSERIHVVGDDTVEDREEVEAILESMTEGVIAVDRESRILTINPALEAIFDIQRAAVRGKGVLQAIRNQAFSQVLAKVLHEGRSVSQELEMLTPVERSFHVQATPLTNRGRIVGAVAVLHDVTALRRLEGMRREFVANVSHELKTPLTSIKGFVETLQEGALDDPENNRKFLSIIADHTERLTRLIDDILSLSQIESREALQVEHVPLKPVVDELALSFQPQLQQRAIALAVDIAEPLPELKADPDRLKQVLVNLLDNAIKFNVKTGRIAIEAREVSGRGLVLIRVIDTGIGIPPDDIPRLFERFYRVDKARSRQLGGTGLGLSIVKHIVEAHGGRADIQSRLGQGTTVTLHWPMA